MLCLLNSLPERLQGDPAFMFCCALNVLQVLCWGINWDMHLSSLHTPLVISIRKYFWICFREATGPTSMQTILTLVFLATKTKNPLKYTAYMSPSVMKLFRWPVAKVTAMPNQTWKMLQEKHLWMKLVTFKWSDEITITLPMSFSIQVKRKKTSKEYKRKHFQFLVVIEVCHNYTLNSNLTIGRNLPLCIKTESKAIQIFYFL